MTKKINVLLVDDEARFRATTSRIMTQKGFNTAIAANGEEALEILKSNPQDVVVLDIMMPGMDGHEALARIKRISPKTQVIMLTGYGNLPSAKKALEHGAFDYLTKPCDVDLLCSKIILAHEAVSRMRRKDEKTAGDIMVPVENYAGITLDTTVKEAIHTLKKTYEGWAGGPGSMESGHRSILVYHHNHKPIGILSIGDLLSAIRPAYLSAPKPSMADAMQYSPLFWAGLFTRRTLLAGNRKVKEIMSEMPPAVEFDANLMDVAERMIRENTRRVVVAKAREIVGILGEQEMLFAISNILDETAD